MRTPISPSERPTRWAAVSPDPEAAISAKPQTIAPAIAIANPISNQHPTLLYGITATLYEPYFRRSEFSGF